MADMLEVKDLCKTYVVDKRQNNVLKNISFTVEEGDMVAIMGPSGSGKSTLLYCVSGMDRPTGGEVNFDGENIGNYSEKKLTEIRRNKMGFIFQQMYMMKNLTIMDNILLPAMENKGSKKSHREKVERAKELLHKMGIPEVADHDINEVSGGQLQRACIARSMINQPKILFADEPTGALNRAASTEVMEEMTRLNEEGCTIMMVTHDSRVAARCKRVLYLVDGTIVGEYKDSGDVNTSLADRERRLNNWLMELGW
ncbi:putative ABC transport system ATP-binding protein [Lachnospiraceae bacterium KHCPX20]|jgi:putative ABC transport system ATP-binding protein|nr:putative ABC transport system ATP-binding protein [Lachnospiraceae bacterium KHCPX20]